MATPKTIYLLRKSIQGAQTVPVLKRSDFPLRFHFKGKEVCIEITPKGNIQITKTSLTGETGK